MSAERPQQGPLATLVQRLAGHAAIYAGGAIFGLLMAMVQVAVLTRLLEPGTFGRFAVLLFYSSLITLVCNLGVVQGSLAAGSAGGYSGDDELGAEEDDRQVPAAQAGIDNRRRLTTGLTLVAVSAVVITGLSVLAAPELSELLLGDQRDATAVVWATAAGVLGSMWRLAASLPRFERRPATYVALQVGRHGLEIAGAIALIEAGYGLAGALAGLAIGKGLGVLAALAVSRHRFRRAVSREDARAILRRGRPLVVISLAFFLSRNVDLYLLSRFVPASDVAVYLVASRIGMIPSSAASATLFAWGPLLRGPLQVALERQRALDAARGSLVTYYVLLATWVVVAITLLADVLVRIAPATYADAAELVPLLAVAAAAHGGMMVVYRMARFPQRTRALRRVGLLSLAVMGAAAALLIPPYGGMGAAVASAVAPLAAMVTMAVLSQRGPEPLPLPWRRLAACVALGLAFVAAGTAAPDAVQPVADVVLVLAFPMLLMVLQILPREEARRLAGLVRRPDRHLARRASLAGLGALGTEDLALLEALLRRNETLAGVAARRLESEAATASRLTGVLRRLGAIGEPTAADDRIGRYVLLQRAATHRDQEGRRVALDARVSPLEVDRLAVLAAQLRSAPDAYWKRAATGRSEEEEDPVEA